MNRRWSLGRVSLSVKVQFMLCPWLVIGPGVAVACWLDSKADGSSTLKVDVAVFQDKVNQSDSPSNTPDASEEWRAKT